MADLAKCSNDKCLLKATCLRWTSPPNEHQQLYATFIPNRDLSCDFRKPIAKILNPVTKPDKDAL